MVGISDFTSGNEAFIWDQGSGMQNFQGALVGTYSLELTGWHLSEVQGVSSDGLTFTGLGTHNGVNEAWVVTFSEPARLCLLTVGVGSVLSEQLATARAEAEHQLRRAIHRMKRDLCSLCCR